MAAAEPASLLAASVAVELRCIAAASVLQNRLRHGLPCRFIDYSPIDQVRSQAVHCTQ
jgi:hypothetical protein